MWAFPLVGAVIGAAQGLVLSMLATLGFPALVAAALTVAAIAALTGALHEDGLADTADGFGGGATRRRKLEIMRDSRIGTYGVLALVSMILVKVSALAAIASQSWPQIVGLGAAGAAASRALMVWLLHAMPPARTDGLASMAGRPTRDVTAAAVTVGLGLAVVLGWLALGPGAGLLAALLACLMAVAIKWLSLRQIGGHTGDVCGATQALSEMLMLAVYAATLH